MDAVSEEKGYDIEVTAHQNKGAGYNIIRRKDPLDRSTGRRYTDDLDTVDLSFKVTNKNSGANKIFKEKIKSKTGKDDKKPHIQSYAELAKKVLCHIYDIEQTEE